VLKSAVTGRCVEMCRLGFFPLLFSLLLNRKQSYDGFALLRLLPLREKLGLAQND
jgi:hypothetical protein